MINDKNLVNTNLNAGGKNELISQLYDCLLKTLVVSYELILTAADNDTQNSQGHEHGERKSLLPASSCEDNMTKNVCVSNAKMKSKILFLNGNTYEGDLQKGYMEGSGKYSWKDGSTVEGNFSNNKICGQGQVYWINNRSRYDGCIFNNFRHGRGVFYSDLKHKIYDGDWHMGSKHGRGTMKYSSRLSYSGQWDKNLKYGYGKMTYSKTSQYCGQWANNMRHGIGTMIWENNDCYSGEWNSGKMEGGGYYTWNATFNDTFCVHNSNVYSGCWQAGRRHGSGLLDLAGRNGLSLQAHFHRNRKIGYGHIFCGNGRCLICADLFRDDKLSDNNIRSMANCRHGTGLVNVSPESVDVLQYILSGDFKSKIETEEKALKSCLRRHNAYISDLYDAYSSPVSGKKYSSELCMTRVLLWQLFIDCKFPQRGIILADFNDLLAANDQFGFKSAHYPFEQIRPWQFVHVLLEVCKILNGPVTACSFDKFIQKDVSPNTGDHIGSVLSLYKDALPLMSVYELYSRMGDAPSAMKILQHIFFHKFEDMGSNDTSDLFNYKYSIQKNVFGIGNRLFYISEKPFENQFCDGKYQECKSSPFKVHNLPCKKIVQCIARVCPAVKKCGLVAHMLARVTFLEFYEILILCMNHNYFSKKERCKNNA